MIILWLINRDLYLIYFLTLPLVGFFMFVKFNVSNVLYLS